MTSPPPKILDDITVLTRWFSTLSLPEGVNADFFKTSEVKGKSRVTLGGRQHNYGVFLTVTYWQVNKQLHWKAILRKGTKEMRFAVCTTPVLLGANSLKTFVLPRESRPLRLTRMPLEPEMLAMGLRLAQQFEQYVHQPLLANNAGSTILCTEAKA